MVSMYNFEKIRKLHAEGKNKSQIAMELGVNWKTVAKYLKSNTPPSYKERRIGTKVDLFCTHLPRVKLLLEMMPDLSDRELFEYIWAEGYRGSERTVNRRLEGLRAAQPKERFFSQQYQAGEQSQFDFKEKVEFPFRTGIHVIYLHISTLPFSSTVRVRAYPSTNYECYMDGIHRFFEGIGGRTENIRIDNLSACVAKVLKGNERKWTAAFARAIGHYGFGVLPCTPGRGNEKGDVERDIRTLSSRIRHQVKVQSMVFNDWEHLNQWLEEFCLSFQKEKSKILFVEEQKSLQVLASRDENILSRLLTVSASTYGTVRFIKSAYSVPDKCIGLVLRVVPRPYDLHVYHLKELVAVHPRKPEGENSILLEHVLPSLVRKPRAMVRWAHREILFPNAVFEKYFQKLKVIDPTSAEREFLKSINLIHYTTLSEIEAGMELVMEHHGNNFFEHLRELLLIQRRPNNVIDINSLRPLRPNLIEYDLFIPQPKPKEKI